MYQHQLRTPDEVVGEKIADAIRQNGYDTSVVAEAADMPATALDDALHGKASLTFEQLVAVGGFLRFPVPNLLEGVTT